MAVFVYKARTSGGERTEGSVEATDRRAATLAVERMGATPVSIQEQSESKPAKEPKRKARSRTRAAAPEAARPKRGVRRLKLRPLLDFTTELSDLLAAGMKLSGALGTMAQRRSGSDGDAIIMSVRDDVVQGLSLSEALAKHNRSFSRLYISMIRAGEASGALPEILNRLVEHLERIQETREKVLMALVYPSFILVAGIITIVFTMAFVIPRFSKIFTDLQSTLPLPTQILISISNGFVDYWWMILTVTVGLVVIVHRYLQTEQGRYQAHRMQLKTPLIRGVVASASYSQFARTLRTLMDNGVHVLQALSIVQQTMTNGVIAEEIKNARERVTDGTTISGPLARGDVFPSLLTDMLAVGEQTGDMSGALDHIARRYEGELDRNVKIMTTALEPILIFTIAIVVGFVAISMLLAVFDMTSGLNI
jgi:general secretion pathway protein F